MNIFVGSLPFRTQEDELNELFQEYGEVSSARIIKDRNTGRSKGYGFVEMPDDGQAQAAIDALNGTDFGGRQIVVNKAQPRTDRPRHDGYHSDRGGYGNNY